MIQKRDIDRALTWFTKAEFFIAGLYLYSINHRVEAVPLLFLGLIW